MSELIEIEEAKNDLFSCAIYLAGKINGNDAQAAVLQPIVLQYLELDDVDNAAHFADTITDSFTRNQLLIAVIVKCVQIDDDDYAFQLIEAIDDTATRASAREAMSLEKAAKGEFEKAFELAETLEHQSDAFSGIAVNQAKKGLEDKALETIERIDFFKSKTEALQEIAIYYLKQDQNEKATNYIENALGLVDEIEFIEDKIRSLLEIGNLFIDAKNNELAVDTFKKTCVEIDKLDGIHKDHLFATVAVGFLNADSLDDADSTLDAVIDKTQISNCLVGFSQVFDKEGDSEEAVDALEESYAILKSQKENEIRDTKSRYQLFATIAVQFAKLGKIERALEIAHENPVEHQTNIALTNIAQFCILQENDAMATQALKGIENDSQRLSALVAMSDAKNKIEQKDSAIELLDEATNMIESIEQFIVRTETQNEIAKRYNFYSQTEKSRKLASDSLQTIEEIRGDENRSFALTELSVVYSKLEFELTDKDKEILHTLVGNPNW